jgi:hypothetical protein
MFYIMSDLIIYVDIFFFDGGNAVLFSFVKIGRSSRYI